MDQNMMHLTPEYTVTDFTPFGGDQYLAEGTSVNSSPSPIMWAPAPQAEHIKCAAFQEQQPYEYQYYDQHHHQMAPVVEFTDLTAPYQEDRRQRRSQARDKQAISSMHMRRRAQNRASQRAFRERKEKHAQDLQRQLDELEGKHKELQVSHDRLGNVNKELVAELEQLRRKLVSLRVLRDDSYSDASLSSSRN